jgi:hypothetical protein
VIPVASVLLVGWVPKVSLGRISTVPVMWNAFPAIYIFAVNSVAGFGYRSCSCLAVEIFCYPTLALCYLYTSNLITLFDISVSAVEDV